MHEIILSIIPRSEKVGLTSAKYLESGSPLSRANAHVSLDVEATIPISTQNNSTVSRLTTAVVAEFDWKAWCRISTIGDLVGLSRALLMSVTLNRRLSRNPNPRTPLMIRDMTMLRGTVRAAFSASSPVLGLCLSRF